MRVLVRTHTALVLKYREDATIPLLVAEDSWHVPYTRIRLRRYHQSIVPTVICMHARFCCETPCLISIPLPGFQYLISLPQMLSEIV